MCKFYLFPLNDVGGTFSIYLLVFNSIYDLSATSKKGKNFSSIHSSLLPAIFYFFYKHYWEFVVVVYRVVTRLIDGKGNYPRMKKKQRVLMCICKNNHSKIQYFFTKVQKCLLKSDNNVKIRNKGWLQSRKSTRGQTHWVYCTQRGVAQWKIENSGFDERHQG